MKELLKFFKSFYYAGRGVISTVLNERNMRVHLVFMIYMFSILSLTDWFVLSTADWTALILSCALVTGAELINTALEHTVDLASGGERSEHAQKAKDAAAGAVLVCAAGAVAVGIKVMFQKPAFAAMGEYFKTHHPQLAVFIISIIAAVLFVFFGGKRKKN